MIRGPILPQTRDGLWRLVASHLEVLERGLSLVVEDLDCSGGQLGAVDGLARDASGAPVLLMVAIESDPLLPARVLSALEFLERVGDALGTAVPEAGFAVGAAGRVVVVGAGTSPLPSRLLRHLPTGVVEWCRLEPFRIGGTERFAVRWVAIGNAEGVANGNAEAAGAGPGNQGGAGSSVALGEPWQRIAQACTRLDPAVRIDGDRFWRRVTWQGRVLAEVVARDGGLAGSVHGHAERPIVTQADVREFIDQIVRRFAALAGLGDTGRGDGGGGPVAPIGRTREEAGGGGLLGRSTGKGQSSDSLRATLAGARLSPEEYSALGGPTRGVGGGAEVAGVADDVVRIVSAQEGPWAGPNMRTD